MIDVAITLDQWGLGTNRKDLVRIAIANDASGDSASGNYNYWISHQGKTPPPAIDLARGLVRPWKSGNVVGFRRQLGAAKLLAAVLVDAFPSGGKR